MSEPRAKTAEEARADFLAHVRQVARYWESPPDRTVRERLEGLAFSILNIFDGTSGLPAMDIVLRPHPDDEAFYKSEDENWFEDGQIINDGVMLHEVFYERPRKYE
jgi:hypothetical protein